MADKISSTEVTQQKKVFVKSEVVLKEMERQGLLEPFTDYYTPDEDEYVSYLRTEVIYDKNISDKNWGYPSGIATDVAVTGKDFSKYDSIKVYSSIGGFQQSIIYEIDLRTPATNVLLSGYPYIGTGTFTAWDDLVGSDSSVGIYFDVSVVNSAKTAFRHFNSGWTSGATPSYKKGNSGYIVYRIEGVLKEPAMTYTGNELFEGYGISLKEGTISSKKLGTAGVWTQESSARTCSTNSTLVIGTSQITKTLNESILVISASCPITNNANGYGSRLVVKINGTEYAAMLSNKSGIFTAHGRARDLNAGTYTVQLCVQNGGSGNTVVPAYETGTATVVEVL